MVASPTDGGTVTGGGAYDTNAVITLKATPKPNWMFQGWTDTNSAASPRTIWAPVGGATYTGVFAMVTGEISLGTNALAFGSVPVGLSKTQTVAVTNSGPHAVKVTSIKLPAGYTATPTAFTLVPNTLTNVTIIFKPTTVSSKTGTVTLVSNAARGTTNLVVTGAGITATRIALLTGPLNFGTAVIGTTNNMMLNIANNGNSPMTVTALAFGSGVTVFKLPGLKVPFSVAVGGSTNLTVTYVPTAVKTNQATLTATVTGITAGSTNTITATGIGAMTLPLVAGSKASPLTALLGGKLPVLNDSTVVSLVHQVGSGALVVRLINQSVPPHGADNVEMAAVVVTGGKAQVVPLFVSTNGTPCTLALECYGTDANNDGIPDAVAAALGNRLKEGVTLMTIQYTGSTINATTPFADILVVEGIPVPLDALPATWQLVPTVK